MSAFLAILGFLIVLDLAWWRLSHRWLRGKPRWRLFNTVFILVQILGFGFLIGGRIAGVRWNLPTPYLGSIYLWHLFILPLLLVGVIFVPLWLVNRFARSRTKNDSSLPADEPIKQTRRQFLVTAATVTPPLVNLALTGFSQGQVEQFRVREMTLHLPMLPAALDGMTVCHVSDLHVGPFTSERLIRQIGERINSLRTDLILFTGDLINSKLSEIPLGIEFLQSLENRDGLALVEGNHDLFGGRAPFENALRAAGLRILVNQSDILPVRNFPVQILGLRWGGPGGNARASGESLIRASFDELLTERNAEAFPILLAHHPHAFDPASAAGIPLTLVGHTHGGQLMINHHIGAGPLMFRYWSGKYERNQSQLVVTNGVGNWFPLRIAAPAEIIHLTLRRAS